MAGTLRGAQRAGQMIVRKGDIGAMLRIERDLEEVEQIAIGVPKSATGRHGSGVDDVIADH